MPARLGSYTLAAGALLVAACAQASKPRPAPTKPAPSAAPRQAVPQAAAIDVFLERVRAGRPLVVAQTGQGADHSPTFGWVQPLTHAQLAGLCALGHSPELVAATFQPAEPSAGASPPNREGLLDWLLEQEPQPSALDRATRRRLLSYLATPLAPGTAETWDLQLDGGQLELTATASPLPTLSLARALRRTGGQASPELRALLSDALAAQGLH